MNMNTQRVNITLSDREVMRLKKIYNDFMEKENTYIKISFTGFCALLLVETCVLIEDGVIAINPVGVLRRTPGRPKNETLLEAFNKGLRSEDEFIDGTVKQKDEGDEDE